MARTVASAALALTLVAWLRLLPLGLPFADDQARSEVRAEILVEIDPALAGREAERAPVDPRVDAWIAAHPEAADARIRARAAEIRERYRAPPGAEPKHTYLGDFDSYLWLRQARNLVESGTMCDAIVDGACRNSFAHAPVGRSMAYPNSVHAASIAVLHRAFGAVGDVALPTSAAWLQAAVGVAGAGAAFALGHWLGGALAGFLVAVFTGVGGVFLHRSLGADNDVWNVLLPVAIVGCAAAAIDRKSLAKSGAWVVAGATLFAVHAATWNGWELAHIWLTLGVVAAGSAAIVDHLRRSDVGLATAMQPLTVGVVFLIVASLFVAVASPNASNILPIWDRLASIAVRLVPGTIPPGIPDIRQGSLPWPNPFATVHELQPLATATLVDFGRHTLIFPFAWAAAPLLCAGLARGGRNAAAIATACAVMAALLFVPADTTAVVLAGSAIVAGLVVLLPAPAMADRGRLLLLLCWPTMAGSILLAAGAQRYAMFLSAPSGILLGGALGLCFHRLQRGKRPRLPQHGWLAWVATALVAASVLPVVHEGWAVATRHRPAMNDAWHATLSAVDDATSGDAIVHTWWDFGYWAQYYARRPTTMDGASLRSAVPYWTARALLARDPAEARALLRMIQCGSAAFDTPEEQLGAWHRLLAAGLDSASAAALLPEIVRTDRGRAAVLLAARGIDADSAQRILGATHCDPQPGVLVLTDRMTDSAAWTLGTWSFAHAFAAANVTELGRAATARVLTENFGYDAETAAETAARAEKVEGPAELRRFAGRSEGYFTPRWVTCDTTTSAEWNCPLSIDVGDRARLASFRFDPRLPVTSRLVMEVRDRAGRIAEQRQAVGTLLLASRDSLRPLRFRDAEHPNLAVAIDTVERRMILGTPTAIESMFTRLVFLDGRYDAGFAKLASHASGDERVTAWTIPWNDPNP